MKQYNSHFDYTVLLIPRVLDVFIPDVTSEKTSTKHGESGESTRSVVAVPMSWETWRKAKQMRDSHGAGL